MPVQLGSENGKCFARWGQEGAKYYYECGNEVARNAAKEKAYKQGVAIGEYVDETFNDYPQSVSDNAARGIRLNEKINNRCATQVGKVRAQQLANREPVSYDTIKRMYSYLSRAKEYYQPNDDTACGTISYLLWGGPEALGWCERKINQIEKKKENLSIEQKFESVIKFLKDGNNN
jgi:hypothetical protein